VKLQSREEDKLQVFAYYREKGHKEEKDQKPVDSETKGKIVG